MFLEKKLENYPDFIFSIDTKLSRTVLDEVGEIAQKVTALCESPTKTNHDFVRVASVQEASAFADKSFDLRRAYSLGTVSPIHEMNKGKASNAIASKKKRKAPLPPGSHGQLVHASSMTSVNSKDEEDGFGMSVTEKKPVKEKRRAPLPPGVNPTAEASSSPTPSVLSTGSSVESTIDSTPPSAPYTGTNALKSQEAVTQLRRASSSSVSSGPLESGSKSPPALLLPPPPIESPPDEVFSPVGPLSATTPIQDKGANFMSEYTRVI